MHARTPDSRRRDLRGVLLAVTAGLALAMFLLLAVAIALPAHASAGVKDLRRQEQRLQRAIDRQHDSLAIAEQRTDLAQDRYLHALDIYTERIVELYRSGSDTKAAALFAARDLGDALDAALITSELVKYDQRVLVELREASTIAAYRRDQLDDAYDAAAATGAQLDQVQAQLATADLDRGGDDGLLMYDSGSGPVPSADNFFTTTPLLTSYTPALQPSPALGGSGPEMPAGLQPVGTPETGEASWYGPGFHGEKTANGETYDQYAMTAAHKTLPHNTWVKVTAVETGRSVNVRINDRGPFVEGRIIDLSFAAKEALGFDGTANVSVQTYG